MTQARKRAFIPIRYFRGVVAAMAGAGVAKRERVGESLGRAGGVQKWGNAITDFSWVCGGLVAIRGAAERKQIILI